MHLDRDEGTVTLATERGMLVVQASPDDLANVAVGDFVVVKMAPGAWESPSASPDTADQPATPAENAEGSGLARGLRGRERLGPQLFHQILVR
jgi:hypothetical protein